MTSSSPPGGSSSRVISAAQGSHSSPARLESSTRPRAAGASGAAVAPEELGPVRGERARAATDVGEGDPLGEVTRPSASGEQGATLRVERADDLQRGLIAERAQNPLDVKGRRQPPGPVATVADPQADQLDRVGWGDENEQVLLQLMAGPAKAGVALAVTDDGRRLAAAGARRRCPELPGLLVAEIEGLARWIGDRVVAPRGQAVHLGVARPGVAGAGLGDQAAEARVGEDVAPRGWRPLATPQGHDVLPAVRREPTRPVAEQQRLIGSSGFRRQWGLTWCLKPLARSAASPGWARARAARPMSHGSRGGSRGPRPRAA